MKHLGLFEGIGGFSLAAKWMGWETLAWCEWNEFGQKVLRYHFPEAEGFGDITKTDFTKYANRIDILTGGDPCQPHSIAGKKEGKEDARYLWPEYKRAAIEIQPGWIVNENVAGSILNGVVDEKIADLEAIGYAWWPPIIATARAFGANHKRQRVFIVAHSERARLQRRDAIREGLCVHERPTQPKHSNDHVFIRDFKQYDNLRDLREPDGLPQALVKKGIHAYGNAVMPQIPFEIYKAIEQYELLTPFQSGKL